MDDGWYVGKLKEVPGVFSQGETLHELQENIQDAYDLVLEDSQTDSFDGTWPKLPDTYFQTMTTLRVTIDNKVAESAQKYATECDTTVDALVQDYLQNLPSHSHKGSSSQLLETIDKLSRPMGGKPWNHRDELHER